MNFATLEFHLPRRQTNLLKVLGTLGGVTFLAGLFFAPSRIWPNLLMASQFLLGLSLAGIFFVAVQYVTGAGWSAALRRVPEAMAALLPLGAVVLGVTLLVHPSLYPWTLPAAREDFAGFKRIWLSLPFFFGRAGIYLLSWLLLTFAILRTSRRQDSDGDLSHTIRNRRLSALFLVVFGITFTLSSFDWLMSIEPRWYSTIFGMYSFAGMFLGGLAALIILLIWVQHLAPAQIFVNESHLHDLGKLLFAFASIWGYLWFCQYMLIWYAHVPEETAYYVRRLHGFWEPLFLLNFALNWLAPFLALMPRTIKRSSSLLWKICVVVLAGRWLDLYLAIVPPFAGPKPAFGVWEIGIIAGASGLFALIFFQALRKAPLVPIKDPYLLESLHHHF